MNIRYAQCWEEPEILRRALAVNPEDDVVSIASGGDNSLALLLDSPRSLVAVDSNPAQVFLVELKKQAIEHFSHDEFTHFLGARDSAARLNLYCRLRPSLSRAARFYWDRNVPAISKGLIHSGKFEKYFRLFRSILLPLIHNRGQIHEFLSLRSLQEQSDFYSRVWNNKRWRALFRVFFGKLLLGKLGRDPSCFRYVTLGKLSEVLLLRARHGLTDVPIRSNYFIEYIFTQAYRRLESAPPYLRPANFEKLKENVGRLRLVNASLDDYLGTLPLNSVSKFNLSDIFEYMSDREVEATLQKTISVARPDSRMAFWTLFVRRPIPPGLGGQIQDFSSEYEELFVRARTPFYGSFCLWRVSPSQTLNKLLTSPLQLALARA
jgi:S-adenosylmethionine-diacylglycerol 3-amino-3-carboxypropyl transferase